MLQFHTGNDAAGPPESLLRTRIALDEARLSRLATQSAIERSRTALAETITLLVKLKCASPKRKDGQSKMGTCQRHQGTRPATDTN